MAALPHVQGRRRWLISAAVLFGALTGLALLAGLPRPALGPRSTDAAGSAGAILNLAPGLCPQDIHTCWRGLIPGRTTMAQAEVLLRGDGIITRIEVITGSVFVTADPDNPGKPTARTQYLLCWTTASAHPLRGCATSYGSRGSSLPIDGLELDGFTPGPRLEEVLDLFGQPLSADVFRARLCGTEPKHGAGMIETILADVWWEGVHSQSVLTSTLVFSPQDLPKVGRLEAGTRVDRIRYFPAGLVPVPPGQAWSGLPLVTTELIYDCP